MCEWGEIIASFWRPHLGDKVYGVHHNRFDDKDEKDVPSDEPRDQENDEGHIAKGI